MKRISFGFVALMLVIGVLAGSASVAGATVGTVTIDSPSSPTNYGGAPTTVDVTFTWTTTHLGCDYHAVITIGSTAAPISQQTFEYPNCDPNVQSHTRTETLAIPAGTAPGSYDVTVSVNEFAPPGCCGGQATVLGAVVISSPLPANADACKKGGWRSLTDDLGQAFVNQGDCVSFVATGGRNKARN